MSKLRVAVGLSGGIDSSFCAYLLKKEGWEVFGFTLKFYPEENHCCNLEGIYQAQYLCKRLKIPHQVLDVQDLFKEKIIRYFISNYLNGLTPNPCAFCNRLIKFAIFWQQVKAWGIEYLATGHYVRLTKFGEKTLLMRAEDKKKSQEYFLSLLDPAMLEKVIFPLGDYEKKEVRDLSRQEKLILKERKESQDVCFVADQNYPEFIERNIPNPLSFEGEIRHIEGKLLGRHKGIYYFTYGQRQGLGLCWKEPLYVIDIDPISKTVFVGEKRYLLNDNFMVGSLNWFIPYQTFPSLRVKVRYNSPFYNCQIEERGQRIKVILKEKIEAITPGQVAVFYYQDIVVGAGIIEKEQFNN